MTESMTDQLTITSEELLKHWKGHWGLTRRVIEAFPDDKLFTYSIGGMRTFGEMCQELLNMAVPTVRGAASGEWKSFGEIEGAPVSHPVSNKEELLTMWDWSTEKIDEFYAQIQTGRFQETDVAVGQWEGKIWWILFYCIDNEIHHRGQGYVYLRSLGIEPPAFYER